MEKLHHANIIVGEQDCRDFVFSVLEKNLNFHIKANPDFLLLESESFGIDDARNLKKWASGKPLIGEIKVYFVITKSITHEAQNALLKVLEEPPAGTYLFISLENLGGLLPTFISRVMVLTPAAPKKIKETTESIESKFLHSNINKKLSIIRSLSKNGDKTPMREFIKSLEGISYKNYARKITGSAEAKAMKNILTAKIFASARGSSPKMLLEWLSCML
jgi:DNA polymerase III delta prime subunit